MKDISKTATVLVAIAALVAILGGGAGAVGSDQMAFAYKGFFNGFAHIKGDNGKQTIEQPTNIDQKTVCLTAGGNSPIDASCTNTANTVTTNTGGIGAVRGSTGDNGKQTIEQPTNIDQKTVCLTAGGNSGIKGSCLNAGGSTTSNTGGITGIGKLPFR
jgi:hypothetical protein